MYFSFMLPYLRCSTLPCYIKVLLAQKKIKMRNMTKFLLIQDNDATGDQEQRLLNISSLAKSLKKVCANYFPQPPLMRRILDLCLNKHVVQHSQLGPNDAAAAVVERYEPTISAVLASDREFASEHRPATAHIAVYAVFKATKGIDCADCLDVFTGDALSRAHVSSTPAPTQQYMDSINRGGLVLPSEPVLTAATKFLSLADALTTPDSTSTDNTSGRSRDCNSASMRPDTTGTAMRFLREGNQRYVLTTLFMSLVRRLDSCQHLLFTCAACQSPRDTYLEIICVRLANLILNNFTKKINDEVKRSLNPTQQKDSKTSQTSRKVSTLESSQKKQ